MGFSTYLKDEFEMASVHLKLFLGLIFCLSVGWVYIVCMINYYIFSEGVNGTINCWMSVATTNIDPERDFGMLDHLIKLKPKALDLAYEGNIMYARNKTSGWRDKLSKEKLDKALDFAKKSKSKQKAI